MSRSARAAPMSGAHSSPSISTDAFARISLKKCATWRAFGWGNCGLGTLDGGLVAGRAGLCGQHFRNAIGRSQAGEAPQILCGCGEEERVSCPIRTPAPQARAAQGSLVLGEQY